MTRWLTIGVLGGLAAWTFPAMADAALKGTCLLAVVLAAEMALRRRSAAVRHLLLVASFGLLLALPLLTLILPGWQVLPEWLHVPAIEEPQVTAESESPAAPDLMDSTTIAPLHVAERFDHEPNFDRNRTDLFPAPPGAYVETEWSEPLAISAGPATVIETADEPPITSSGVLTSTARNLCVLAWLAGAALLLLRLAFGAGLLWRARRRATLITDGPLYQLLQGLRGELALRRPVRLYLGSNRAMPMAWGLWRACILVPVGIETWAPSQQRAVLLHELGHVARRDPLWQLIVELARALYWFHPLVWLAAWRVHVEREQACDDLVISRGVAAQDYARHLLDVVSRGRLRTVRPATGVAMASTHKLAGRVRSILDERRNRRPVTRTVAVAGLLACVAIGLPLAMMRAADDGSTAEVSEQAAEATTADTDTDLSANNPDVPTIELDSPEDVTRRVRELLYILRQFRVFSRSDEWGGAMRELIEIGKTAVPELVAELDRTDRDETLSAIGFVLRGIGDPRAVPALIRNIPKLLRAPRSDYGIHIHDPELRAFLNQHERYPDEDSSVTFGRPVNELLDTLQKLTGHSEPRDEEDDPLRHITLGGGREQRARAREAYAARQAHWEQWWSAHRGEFVTAEALRSLELPPQQGDPVAEAGLARFGPLFPTGPDVRLGPVQEVELDSYSYWDAPSHLDFDTGRVFQYLEDAEQLEPEAPGDTFSIVVNWPPAMGIDVRGNEGDDLYAWQIDNKRWDTIEDEVHRNEPLPLGPEATDWLVRFDQDRTDFQYDQIGTFLVTTREGGRGIVQSHPRDVLTGMVKLRYRMWIDEQHPESQPPHARPRDTTGPAFGEAVTLKLQTPGRGKPFLLDLDTGQAITPPDLIVPADATAEFWYSDSELFAEWCREKGIDLATRLTQYESGTTELQQVISLIGMRMRERKVLPAAFDTMTVPEAWEILRRYPETSEYAWMSPTADIPHLPDTFVVRTSKGRIALLRLWETAEDGSSITIHYRLGPDPQDRSGADAGRVIRGRVVNDNNRPVADAGVWFRVDLLRDERTVHTATNAEGRFELDVPAAWRNEAEFPAHSVWVWHEDHGLGLASAWAQLQRYTDEVTITLDRPTEETVFEVVRPDGTPASDARVTPLDVKTPGGYIPAPPGLRKRLPQPADAQGRVAFRTVPRELLNSVQVDADGFGTQVLYLGLDGYEERDRNIVLGAAGQIEGRIETDDPALLDGLTLYFETRDPGWLDPFWTSGDEDEIQRRLNAGNHPRKTRGTAVVRVGSDGRFAVPAIAGGRLLMNSSLDETAPHGVRLTDVVVDVEAGRTQQIAAGVAPRITVRGTVVRQGTGEPVPDAIVSVNDGEDGGELVATDEKGQFTCSVLAGPVEIGVEFIRSAPDGWRQLSASRVVVEPADGASPVTLPDVVIGQSNDLSALPAGEADDEHTGSLSIDYDVFGGPHEATFMLNLSKRAIPVPDAPRVRREIRVTNGERASIGNLVPGTYQLARIREIRFADFERHFWLDYRTVEVTAGQQTETRFVREEGARVRGRVVGLGERVGDAPAGEFGQTLACVRVCGADAPDPEFDTWTPSYDAAPCDSDGQFETAPLEPGTYTIYAHVYRRLTPEERRRTGDIQPSWRGSVTVTVPEQGEPEFVEITLEAARANSPYRDYGPDGAESEHSEFGTTGEPESSDEPPAASPATGAIFGSLSIEYDVFGGPHEATFMLNLSKRATPDPGAGIEERDVRVVNGESKVVERLIPGTYQMARIKPIRFPDFSKLCWLDYREVVIEPGQRTETRFVRGEGRPVRGRVLGLRERVGDFGQDGSQDGAGVRETLACVLVRGADAPDPELVSGPPWHPDFDVAPCQPDGRFATAPLEPGTYKLYAHAYRRLTPEQRVRTGDILPSWRGAATVTVAEEGEPEFVEITLEPFEPEPAVQTNPDDGPNSDGGASQPGGPTSQVAPAVRPAFTGEIDLRELVATLLPNHRLRLDDQDAPTALVSPESGELKIPAGGDVEGGPIGYWVSPAMTFLSDARTDVSDAAAAARLIQLLHALCKGPDFVRQKIYRPRAIDNGWLVEVDHDFENFPGMIPFIHPYEILVDEDNRVTSLRQRSNVYLGNAEVYVDTITTVYEREVRVNGGRNYPEVLDEELKQAWAREQGVPLRHNSLVHYPNSVISVADEDTGERFYVESNGARVFFLNRDGATVRIVDAVRATDLEHLVGAPVVRHLELRDTKLLATVGKHTLVTIDRASGEIESVVSD